MAHALMPADALKRISGRGYRSYNDSALKRMEAAQREARERAERVSRFQTDSRQQRRRREFLAAFAAVNEKHFQRWRKRGHEFEGYTIPRRARRKIARARIREATS